MSILETLYCTFPEHHHSKDGDNKMTFLPPIEVEVAALHRTLDHEHRQLEFIKGQLSQVLDSWPAGHIVKRAGIDDDPERRVPNTAPQSWGLKTRQLVQTAHDMLENVIPDESAS
jgi:hypothetical protein